MQQGLDAITATSRADEKIQALKAKSSSPGSVLHTAAKSGLATALNPATLVMGALPTLMSAGLRGPRRFNPTSLKVERAPTALVQAVSGQAR